MENSNLDEDSLVEPLTRREAIVLSLLADNLMDREIAERLTLALSSVKGYARQIYSKLGVDNRRAAVVRARQLGLLGPKRQGISSQPPSTLLPQITNLKLSLTPTFTKNNLPAQLTSFIGREQEITELCKRIKKNNARLLTLTGSGGTGKTRLAQQVAAELMDVFTDGVWLVELAPVADPLLVPQTVIAALGLVEQPDRSSIVFLKDYLREKQLLLILDNCEHLVEACAELAELLLRSAPRLTVLATSREILGVMGEVPYRVPPLTMPDLHHLPPVEEITRYEAVKLFVERARYVDPTFMITEENVSAVAQITQQLDGIPLALELAAARLRLLSVGQVALRLKDSFRLLAGGSRTALPRHQTLQALIDWSYDLLSETERRFFRGLSVFVGDWTLEAAEEVGGETQDILTLLGQLADKSLILAVPTPHGEMHYRMLETVRQYALARLVKSGEKIAVYNRHLDFYLRLCEGSEPNLRNREQIPTLDKLSRELDNLRVALEWSLQEDIEAELRLASALEWFWAIRYHWTEGITWLEHGLEAETLHRGALPLEGGRALIRAKALTAFGHLRLIQDGQCPARPIFEEALTLYRASGLKQNRGIAWVLLWLGSCKMSDSNSAQGLAIVEEALGLFRTIGDSHGMAECLGTMGDWEIDMAQKKKIIIEMLSIVKANGDSEGTAAAFFNLGNCSLLDGDYENAQAEFAASLDYYRQVSNPSMIAFIEKALGFAAHCNGDLEQAALYLEESIAHYRTIIDDAEVAICIFWKGMNAFARGYFDQVVEFTAETGVIAQKTGNLEIFTWVSYLRARLARLCGKAEEARLLVENGLNLNLIMDLRGSKMWVLLESGYLALQDGDLGQARVFFNGGLQILIRWNMTHWLGFPLDGLAVLAVREGRIERAARLFGTRQWRGASHLLSSIEVASREIDLAQIKSVLGQERFTQLQEETKALTFNQVMALVQEEG